MASELAAQVIAAESERCRAITEQDWPALEALIADELSYTHFDGRTENRTEFLKGQRGKARTATRSDLEVRAYESFAVMTGIQRVEFTPESEDAEPHVVGGVVLQAWIHRDGRWQLVAFQGTRRLDHDVSVGRVGSI